MENGQEKVALGTRIITADWDSSFMPLDQDKRDIFLMKAAQNGIRRCLMNAAFMPQRNQSEQALVVSD
jgi:hypothetical protein